MSNYKMIIMNMNDTLITSDNVVSSETKDYLIQSQEEGYKIVLASRRPTEGMVPVTEELKLDHYQSYIISYNGGKTTDAKTEEIEVSKSVTKDHSDKITDYCREEDFLTLTYQDGQIIFDAEHEHRKIESELTGLPTKQVDDIKTYIQSDVPKAMGVDYEENISRARSKLNEIFNSDIDVTTSRPFFLEFMARDVSKGNAIEALCKKLNISLSEVICFGDSLNDQSVFEVVGYAVAMGNASEELKKIANKVTLDNDSNGIPAALKELL